MTSADSPFRSFWMGGFECSTHINSVGLRLDMIAAVEHDLFCAADYRRLRDQNILVARDGLRWHLIEHASAIGSPAFDWSSWIPMIEAARAEKIQVIWDLFHYGLPDGLDVFAPSFADRFARFAGAAARIHREHSDEIPIYAPVNEISFFSWAASRDFMFPWAHGRDSELKRQLVLAAIAAIDSIRAVDARARFIAPEPLIHTMPARSEPWNIEPSRLQRESQFEAWDMIAGRSAPELGGAEKYLDIIGANFYAANEWEVPGGQKLHWDDGSNDPRWMPLNRLLAEVYLRYRRPLFLAETSHYGIGRAPWLREVAGEVRKAIDQCVPVSGICLYPILDRFDWEDRSHWHNCGLWDFEMDENGHPRRVLNEACAAALHEAQKVPVRSL